MLINVTRIINEHYPEEGIGTGNAASVSAQMTRIDYRSAPPIALSWYHAGLSSDSDLLNMIS